MSAKTLHHQGKPFAVNLKVKADNFFNVTINDESLEAILHQIDNNTLSIVHDNRHYTAHVAANATHVYVLVNGEQYVFEKPREQKSGYRPGMEAAASGNEIFAPMPGKIIKIFVKKGQKVKQNDRLFIVEAMKMENEVKSSRAGKIKKVNFKENDLVSVGDTIIEMEASE
jgi:biotin carboxyl carrier protein